MSERFYITTPIYYVNAEPHIGHAYSTIVADVLNRFQMLSGTETFFLTGTDEHGDKIVSAAEKFGQSPKEYVDQISQMFRDLWPKLNISYNRFIRTTDPYHQETVRLILSLVKEKGDIYFSEYEGLYCFGCERFYTDRELEDGKCPDHKTEPEVIKESNYFFRMSRYQEWLIDHINGNPDFIRPERYRNEVLSFLSEPLEDLCISRPKSRLTWGITLPFDEDFVTYVWFDALINYVSAIGYPEGSLFEKFWPSAQHVIAKDILKPHGIYWPCMLKSAGIEPYRHLNVHGYWNIRRGKMSKSLGNVVRPLELVDIYGLDAFRYFLLREMVFGLDSEFSEAALVARLNADLANDLGNLVSRSLTMAQKYFKGDLPEPGPSEEADEELKRSALELVDIYEELMKGLTLHKSLMAIWEVIGKVNKYIDTMAPWVLAKSDRERLSTVICHIFESLRIIAGLLWPFMPGSAEKIQDQLSLSKRGKDFTLEDLKAWGRERPVRSITKAPALFPRVEEVKKEKKSNQSAEKGKAPANEGNAKSYGNLPLISYEDFQKLDLRVGTIKAAEAIPGSRKLIKLTVDIGEKRTVVAGLKDHYSEEDLIGIQILLVANLEPVKLMDIESRGMVLAAADRSGLHLLVPDTEAAPGSKVK
ncbi:MAG: methionine--tRNA ligase [Desulfobacterales bacterium]|nr:methionine--tRNA ligase [Desulfobacterales bacterium]MBL7101753.1 methionine--tRNA ligase [Desulfobacteraceae bacterium]